VFSVLLRRTGGELSLSAGAVWAVSGAALYSVSSVVLRHTFTVTGVTGWTGLMWLTAGSAGAFTFYFVCLYLTSRSFVETIHSQTKVDFALLLGRMCLFYIASGLIVVSISMGPVSIVSSLLATQTVFLVLATTLLAKWSWSRPRIPVTPSISQTTKFVASIAVIIGVYLIS
jgi:drug/metabolite transporter (DMT)-like permease